MSSLKRQKTFVSENDLKQFVQATMQEYGVGITKIITLKTLYQVIVFVNQLSGHFEYKTYKS